MDRNAILDALRAERDRLDAAITALDVSPQPARRPIVIRHERPRRQVHRPRLVVEGETTGTAERRALIVKALRQAGRHGLTSSELKQQTRSLTPQDRTNSLTQLRRTGVVSRVGNSWQLIEQEIADAV